MRVVGIDLGDKRVGVAVSNSERTIAVPTGVFLRKGNARKDLKALADEIDDYDPEVVVVGLPLSLSGGLSAQAKRIVAESKVIARFLVGRSVELFDERYSSKQAERYMRETGHSSKTMRGTSDAYAASIILQAWLDNKAAGTPGPKDKG
ncbi:putative holliday junction resolvase [Ferrithrix thermotolerans DSM 19514]|uniref:Putative pre-16S rRNA nuclease n=1 Tax=Ferrithrix thermotolerans DSM 19514 TaxID=1121881 RepID=A0A1M4SHB5_9ACTN|nr:Holliday junction resolvase RuvX [Ferrithrix thermotolerans]SHE31576.1 putative holliday junction resolvase [Ferrithrix thermotolerans DSM 19514]